MVRFQASRTSPFSSPSSSQNFTKEDMKHVTSSHENIMVILNEISGFHVKSILIDLEVI